MPINYPLIGIRIKETRNQQGISAEELAELADLSSVYISYIENAKRKPSLESLVKICNALVMADCSKNEKRFIFLILSAVKDILRSNDWSLIEKILLKDSNLKDL